MRAGRERETRVIVLRLLIGRILLSLLTLIIVSAVIFAIIEVLPGDVASRILGRDATPASLALLREKLHLNDPAILRYVNWLAGILQGDFGNALTSSRPIMISTGTAIGVIRSRSTCSIVPAARSSSEPSRRTSVSLVLASSQAARSSRWSGS